MVLGAAPSPKPDLLHDPVSDLGPAGHPPNVAINALKTELNKVLNDQQQLFVTMKKRVNLTPLKKYLIPMDDTPAWRIHDWFPGNVLYANAFHAALTYGDPSGAGYDRVSAPRVRPADGILSRLSPDAAAYLRGELAMLDIADSTIIRGTDDNGRQRFNGREESRTIDLLQQAVTSDDDQPSITAVMDTISAPASWKPGTNKRISNSRRPHSGSSPWQHARPQQRHHVHEHDAQSAARWRR